ncbi:unnamed protein product, partial [Brassica oleracea var. botrytis]
WVPQSKRYTLENLGHIQTGHTLGLIQLSLEKAKTVKTWTPHLPQSSQSFNAGSVTVPRLKTLILRPPSVPGHFNRYVLRHQLGCSQSGRVYSSAAVNGAISDLVEPVSHSSLLLVGLSSQL